MRNFLYILIAVISCAYITSCEEDKYVSSSQAQLSFSSRKIQFDTIFTTVGTATQYLKVYNPYDQKILISSIRLASNENTNFKLNINGAQINEIYGTEILPHDSIYIFVDVTIDPLGADLPFVLKDSIEFTTNEKIQYINLVAWGQDVVLVRDNIAESTTWTAEKPYLVDSSARVEEGVELKIDPGVRVYFHNNTGLYVKGRVIAEGTVDQPVIFQGYRLESAFKNVPGQWNGILLFSGSHDNVFNHVEIKNANIALQVGTIEDEGFSSVVVSNSKLYNQSYAGIFALKSKIRAYNTLILNCGYYGAALLVGGDYEFYHTTIANYNRYNAKPRKTASLMISDHIIIEKKGEPGVPYVGNLSKAYFGNSIITGDIESGNEVELAVNGDDIFNFKFDHCLLQLADTFKVDNISHYISILKGVNPRFIDPFKEMNFELDTLSPAKNAGSREYSVMFPYDILNRGRVDDAAPDLGAYERIEKSTD